MRPIWYVQNADGTASPTTDYAAAVEVDRTVAKTEVADGILVSTVFLGLDHSFDGGPPVLWETMVFGGPLDGEQERYTSRAAAKAGHALMLMRAHAAQRRTP